MSVGPKLYHLRYTLKGAAATLPLSAGKNTIGKTRESDITLPSPAVSHHHAIITLENNELEIEDLGSKNGTFVNGKRIEKARIELGDTLQFGPLSVDLEHREEEDTTLAIPFRKTSTYAQRIHHVHLTGLETEDWTNSFESVGLNWISLVSSVQERSNRFPADYAETLGMITEKLGADGAHLFDYSGGGEPAILASHGDIPDFDRDWLDDLKERSRSFVATEPVLFSTVYDRAGQHLVVAALVLPPNTCRGLVLTSRSQHHQRLKPLLEVLLRLMFNRELLGKTIQRPTEATQKEELLFPDNFVVGSSFAIRSAYEQLQHLLVGDIPVLFVGETGVGKEVFASLLHLSSKRRQGPLISINCAAIPPDLLEAELFGIKKGVATGVDERKGKFQHAAQGVLFLDEVGDMSLALQAKLLRALQGNEIAPVGSATPEPIDVRIIAATNVDLVQRVKSGKFRSDLYYRIAGFVLRIPALRERRDDIPQFVDHFMHRYAEEIQKPLKGITVKALIALKQAGWPGNIRQLMHEVRSLVYLCTSNAAICYNMISDEVLETTDDQSDEDRFNLKQSVETLERNLVATVLAHVKGNRTHAAKLLGISRMGLLTKIKRYGLGSD